MMTFSPLTTCSKWKAKVGKSIWDEPATTPVRAHNVIIDDNLKGLSSVFSHKLVSRHIHKLVQVFCSTFLHYSLSNYTCKKLLTHLFFLGSWWVPPLNDGLLEQWGEGGSGQLQGWFRWGQKLKVKEGSDWGYRPVNQGQGEGEKTDGSTEGWEEARHSERQWSPRCLSKNWWGEWEGDCQVLGVWLLL